MMGIRAVAENISDETDPVVVEPMKRVFAVIERVLKFNRGVGGNPKLFQAAIECISKSKMYCLFVAFSILSTWN